MVIEIAPVVLETKGLGTARFHGRVAILVNEQTTCTAEMVALLGQECGLATIVGMPTPGRLISHRGFDIGHGFTLVIPTGAYVSWLGIRLDANLFINLMERSLSTHVSTMTPSPINSENAYFSTALPASVA